MHCLKYGLTLHNVLRVRGVTIEGHIVEVGSTAPDSAGYDLLPLVVGSEGLLLVLTEATLKLVPKPLKQQVVMASFDDVEKGGDAVAAVIAAGIIPAGMEMMDKPRPRRWAVRQCGPRLCAAAILFVELTARPRSPRRRTHHGSDGSGAMAEGFPVRGRATALRAGRRTPGRRFITDYCMDGTSRASASAGAEGDHGYKKKTC